MNKQLPPRPNLEQLRKQAKAILKGQQSAAPDVLTRIREHHPRWRRSTEAAICGARFTLADAQLTIANEHGFATWAKLKVHIALHAAEPSIEADVKALREAAGGGDLARINSLLDGHPE